MQEPIYHFDKITINSEEEVKKVSHILTDNGLSISAASYAAQQWGYKSRIDLVAPSMETLAHLRQHKQDIWPYTISYIEIAKDIFFNSDSEADSWVRKQLEILRKRWSFGGFNYDQYKENEQQRAKRKIDDMRFGTITGYRGSQSFQFVIYARKSKINGQPCAHLEWCIHNSSNIREKTDIISIGDLVAFDCKAWFEPTYRKFISVGMIEREKLGKFLLGIDGRQKNLSKSKEMEIDLTAGIWLSAYQIDTYSELVDYIKQEKDRIKHQVGPKTRWDRRILSIKSYDRFKASIL